MRSLWTISLAVVTALSCMWMILLIVPSFRWNPRDYRCAILTEDVALRGQGTDAVLGTLKKGTVLFAPTREDMAVSDPGDIQLHKIYVRLSHDTLDRLIMLPPARPDTRVPKTVCNILEATSLAVNTNHLSADRAVGVEDNQMMMRSFTIPMRCGTIAAMLLCHTDCRSGPPIWKDILKRETARFLASRGVAAKQIVIGNSGEIELDLSGSGITNLNVLVGMPLETLNISGCPIRDLEPLREMRLLRRLNVSNTAVADLSPLESLKLHELRISKTRVRDLKPIRNMPMQMLGMVKTEVHDLAPIQRIPLQEIYFSADASHSDHFIQTLRNMKSLHCINFYGYVTNFWDDYDSGKFKVIPAE